MSSQSSSQERNLQASELYYAQNSSQSPVRNQNFKNSHSNLASQQMSKIDLRQGALDSRIILAQQTNGGGLNNQPFLLETISSNESRFASSPNFLARSKESFNPTQFGGGVAQSIQFHQDDGNGANSFGGTQQNIHDIGGGMIGSRGINGQSTQIINVPMLNMNRQYNQFESISYSASSEFGQHSLRSSVEQQNSHRGFNHLADQIRLEQYQIKNYQNPLTILEESKEEDVSFNKSITNQSPIPVRQRDGTITGGPFANNNMTGGTGGVYFDNKSSIDDGTRSLLMHMRGVPGMDSQDHFGTLGSVALRNTSILGGGGIAGNARPNFNISSGSQNAGNFLKFMGTSTPQKSATQLLNGQKLGGKIQDQELLDELGGRASYDPKASTQQQVMSSLQISDEQMTNSVQRNNNDTDFNVMDEIGSARQDGQNTNQNSEIKQQRSLDRLDQNQLQQSSSLGYQTFKNNNIHQQQQQVKNDPIRIDDNQFVTLNQIPEEGGYYYGNRNSQQQQQQQQQFYSGRPSNVSQYGQYMNQNMFNGGGTFSDGQSSSTSHLNTPYQNQNSRLISPYPFSRRDISGSQISQKCQCCQAPLHNYNQNRPISGLSQIETKDLNYFDKNTQNDVQTPQLASEVDQSTKILSHKDGALSNTDQVSSYKAVLCLECQSRILNKENLTPMAPSDLKGSLLTNSNIMVKSHIQNFDELQINSNLSSIHQHNNLASSSNQFLSHNNPSQLNHLKFTSSLMGQSELQSSYLTQSNNNNNLNNNPYIYPHNNNNNYHQQQSQPLQVNSLLMNSESIHNPALQSSSLHYLSYLSQNLGSQLKQSDQNLTQKYGLNTQDNYKVALKSYMNRQFERSARQGSGNDSNGGSIQYSKIFRERQSRRMFDQLQNIKSEYCQTYDELEAMHTGLLLGNITNNIK